MSRARYKIEIEKRAAKEIKALGKSERAAVMTAIGSLAENPTPVGAKALKGEFKGLYRIRVANVYRVVYSIKKDIVMVTVVRVRHRKDIYR